MSKELPSFDFEIYTMAGPKGFARIEIQAMEGTSSHMRMPGFYCDAPALRRLAAQLEFIAQGLEKGIGVSTRPAKEEPAF